ncbi:MAG: hypothetical protein GIKADHBN_01012 [Phycisphaerales bacterium]|nr:hypothetical protein [Phycisphaerales bacterium]
MKRNWTSRVMGVVGVAGIACVMGLAVPAMAQDTKAPAAAQPAEGLPEFKEIQARFIEALGGEDALRNVTSRTSKANFDIPAQNMKGTVVSFQKNDAMFAEMELAGMKMESGYADGVVWQRNPMAGPMLIEGPEREEMIKEADLQSELDLGKYFSSMQVTGTADVDGKKAYKVEMTPIKGEKHTRFYDAESGLLVKIEAVRDMQGSKVPTTTRLLDYRQVDGVKIPFKMVQTMMNIESSMVIESLEINKDIAEDKLSLPADIKALVEKKKSGGEPKPEAPKPDAPKK